MLWNQKVIVDQQMQEKIQYDDPDFPLARFIDQLDHFVDGAFLCHWHTEFEFAIVLSGRVSYQLDQQTFVLDQGDGIFIGSQTLHSAQKLAPNTVIFNIQFPPNLFNTVLISSLYRRYFSPIIIKKVLGCLLTKETAEGNHILQGLRQIYETTRDKSAYELACLEILLRIWRNLLPLIQRSASENLSSDELLRDHRMRKMVAFIQSHFNIPITVENIAEAASISRSECFRCFSLFCHTAPMEYVNRYRLQCAAQRLSDTSESIADVCYACGFSSSSYFGKAFRKAYGLTPSEYRHSSR